MRAWKALVNLLVRKKVGGDSVYGISFNIGAAQWESRFFSWASNKSEIPISIISPKCFTLANAIAHQRNNLEIKKPVVVLI
jgi:hypothetical protein